MQRCLSKLKRRPLGMLANGMIRQGCESMANVECKGMFKDNKEQLRMTSVSSLVAWFLVRDFFSFKKL